MNHVSVGYGGAEVLAPGDAATMRATLDRLQAAGITQVGAGDHVSFHVGAGSDGLLTAAAILGASELRVMLGVYLLSLRHPLLVARQLADIAGLSPGRLTFGVGIGGEDPLEVANSGVDPSTRGRRTDESLEVLRRLMNGGNVSFEGEFFRLHEASIVPTPAVPIPILVGGRSDAAIRRAARFGDGWLGIWVSARRYAEVIETMSGIAADEGRGDVAWHNGLNIWCGVGDTRESARAPLADAMQAFYQMPFEPFERWSPYGTVDDLAAFMAPYVDAGCNELNVLICGEDTDTKIDAVARLRKLLTG